MKNEVEWEIGKYGEDSLVHNHCKMGGGGNNYETRKKWGFHCSWCEKPIPKYILFQWKLLNSK